MPPAVGRVQQGGVKATHITWVEDDWDSDDGEFDASKLTDELVFGEVKRWMWVLNGNTCHSAYDQSDDTLTRGNTLEIHCDGTLWGMAIESKKQGLRTRFNKTREHRDDVAIEAPRLAFA